MGRRSKNYSLGMFIILILIVYFIGNVFSATGYTIPIIIVGCIITYFIYKFVKEKKHENYIHNKYPDDNIARMILANQIWQGQTDVQLRDSLGSPIDVDRTVMKTKTKEVWKYNQKSAKRFGLKVILDNGIVTGWENKGQA